MKTDSIVVDPRIARHPVLRALGAFPIACFTCALGTDIAYTQTANMMWDYFSTWLLAVGLGMGVLAAIAGVISYLASPRLRAQGPSWTLVLGSLIVLVLGLFNNLYHSRDAWTSVVPEGLILSALTVVVMLVTAWASARTTPRAVADVRYSGVRQ